MISHNGFRVSLSVLLLVALAVPALPMLESAENAQAADPSPTLRIGFLSHIDSLNPYVGVSESAQLFYSLVYDALTSVDNKLNVTPNLALSSWAVPTTDPEMIAKSLPYGSLWQYNLTSQAYWCDGQPFTADDAVWNVNLNAGNYTDLWAYQPYAFWMNYAEKVDSTTMRILFYSRMSGEPMPAAYAYHLPIFMLPEHLLGTTSAVTIGYRWTGVFDSQAFPVVGTGPFIASSTVYSDWLAGDAITLNRNPDYHWGAERGMYVKVQQVQLKFYDDALAMQNALLNSEIDVAQFPQNTYLGLKNGAAYGTVKNIQTFDGPKVTQYWTEIGICDKINGKNPSRLDPAIKHAMAMATNRSYIVDNFYLGFADVGSTVIPPINSYWHYEPTPSEKFSFDPVAARTLLEDNGYIDTNADGIREATATSPAVLNNWVAVGTPLTYEMLVRAEYPEEKEIAKYLKTQWNQIGIDFNYVVVDESTLVTIVYSYEYDLMIWYWDSDIDPNEQLFEASSMAIMGWNDIYYQSKAYDDNYTMSVRSMDKNVRHVYVDNAQRVLYRDANYIILAYVYQTYAWRTDTWAGWGDWAQNPGRSLDNFWGANPLWFDLIPQSPTLNLIRYEDSSGFALPVPEDWALFQNQTIAGQTFNIVVRGPIYNNFQTNVLVLTRQDSQAREKASYLHSLVNETLDGLPAQGINATLIEGPDFITVSNHSAVVFAIQWNSEEIAQKMAVVVSEPHRRAWIMTFSVDSLAYPLLNETFNRMIEGFEVTLSTRVLSIDPIWMAAGAAIGGGAVAAAFLLLGRRRKTRVSPWNDAATQDQSAGWTVDNGRLVCPKCHQANPMEAAFCSNCGFRSR